MGDNINPSSTAGLNSGGSGTFIKITRITMVVTAIFVFLVIAFVIFLYIHAHYSLAARATARRRRWGSSRGRSHFVFASGDLLPSLGLDPVVLRSLPVTIYQVSEFKQGIECAICLSELADGDKARLLPNCTHGFHLECIDMWFQSHSTCPICRCLVDGEDGRHLTEPQAQEERMLEISIPAQSTEMLQSSLPPLPSNRSEVAEMNSSVEESGSPEEIKVGSLKRILSGGMSTCCRGPGVDDIEQGIKGFGEGSSVFFKEL